MPGTRRDILGVDRAQTSVLRIRSMANLFDVDEMASGYAQSRPPIHVHIIDRVRSAVEGLPVARALDVGCGAGISTKALQKIANVCLGLEPSQPMLPFAGRVAPGALFVAGSAEYMPLPAKSVDLIGAAGSLNYVDLDRFFPEAARVLRPKGLLLVYDFSPGRSFRDNDSLDQWFRQFVERYPFPANDAHELSPPILARASSLFRVVSSDVFEIGVVLQPEFYLNYMMTETNVAAAVRRGIRVQEIKQWSAETLGPLWNNQAREVLFQGYWACMSLERAEELNR